MAGFGRTAAALVVLAGLSGLGCGEGSDDQGAAEAISESTARGVSGVYQVTRFTRNDGACDAEGPSVASEVDGFFVAASSVVFGQRILQLVSCSGVDDCRMKAIEIQNLGTYTMQYSFTLSRELDPAHLTGFTASTGTVSGDSTMCTDPEYSDHDLTVDANGVVLESRTKILADRPKEDGFCVVRPAESKAEAAGVACSKLRVLAGTKVAEL